MEKVVETIARYDEDKNIIFVFPSEVVAAFWRERSLLLGTKKAVRSDRFLSWDRFKEDLFALTRETRPVNSIHRLLFAASLMEENRKTGDPLFSTIIDPRYRAYSARYTDSIVSALPGLKTLTQRISASGSILESGLERDVLFLWERYNQFLREYDLFEPEYEEFAPPDWDTTSYLFYPEIIQDYSRFAPQLSGISAVVPVIAADEEDGKLIFFDNALQEIRHVLSSIEDLLFSGAAIDSIGITLADPGLLPHLQHEAALRGMPLTIRRGDTLSAYPAGRLFHQLREVAVSDYSFAGLKNLLMNRRYPWKSVSAGEELIAFGVSQFCMRGREEWKKRISSHGTSFMADYFANLTGCLSRIGKGASFRDVKQNLFRYIHTFFDDAGWEDEDEMVFQSCINVLNEMIEAELSLPGIPAVDPFSLFVKTLSSRVYVSRERSGGVSVFPYRVTAGTGLPFHFVAGVSEFSTRVIQSGFPYLREDQKKQLDLEETDFTDQFLKVYAGSGEKVVFTGSREGVSDSHRAPSFFLRQDAVSPPPKGEESMKPDRFRREADVWSNRGVPSLEMLYPVQHEGIQRAAATSLSAKGEDWTRHSTGDLRVTQVLMDLQKEEQTGMLQISPTRLEGFGRCPFRYLFSSVLETLSGEYDSSLDDPRVEGILYHAVLGGLFSSIQAEDARFDPSRRDVYKQLLHECVKENFKTWKHRGGYFMPPIAYLFKRRTVELLSLLLDRESEAFPLFEILSCEHSLSFPSEEMKVYLTGRIDRISRNEEGVLLVDYKKRNRVNRNDLLSDPPESFQMPFYALLAEESGMEVAHIAYYDIERKEYSHVLRPPPDKSWTDPDSLRDLINKTRDSIRHMTEAVYQGAYCCTKDSARCIRCEYRRICRERYVLG